MKRKNIGLLVIAIIFLAIVIGIATGSHSSKPPAASPPAQAAPSAAASSSAPAQAQQTVTYVVTGDSADVTYGPDGTDLNGSVPMRVTKPLGSPSYYAINAQLNGDGTVNCKIKVDGKVISSGTASGQYNIATCEISQDPISGAWENDQ